MTRLRDLGDWSGGNTPSKANAAYWTDGTIPWVSPKDMKVDEVTSSEDRVSEAALKQGRVSIVPEGSVLVVTRSGILSHTLPVAVTKTPVTINQDLKALTPKTGVLPKYVAHALRGASRRILKECSKHGTTVASIETNTLLDFEIPLVDVDEQNRIVAEIEKQFSRLDEAVANLKRVKANLRNLRASALNSACEGPWPSIEFGLLARDTLVGLDRGRDQQRSVGPGHRYVKMNNVSMDGEIQPEGIVYVDASSQEATRYALRSGDILFNTRNSVELVGKSAIVPPELEGALYNNNLMRIRTTPEIDSAFLAMQMCTPAFRRQLEKVKRATTSVAAIYLKDLVRLPVIVPPVTEQCRIVAEVERRLSIIREVAAEAERNSQRAQALRQAVLQRAFAGEPEVRIAA